MSTIFSSPVNIKPSSGTFPTPDDLPVSLAGLKPTSTLLTLVTLELTPLKRCREMIMQSWLSSVYVFTKSKTTPCSSGKTL